MKTTTKRSIVECLTWSQLVSKCNASARVAILEGRVYANKRKVTHTEVTLDSDSPIHIAVWNWHYNIFDRAVVIFPEAKVDGRNTTREAIQLP